MRYTVINQVKYDKQVVGYDLVEKETNQRMKNVPIEQVLEYTREGLVDNCEVGINQGNEHVKRKRSSKDTIYRRQLMPMLAYRVYNKRLKREEYTTLKMSAFELNGSNEAEEYALDLSALKILDITEKNSIHWQAQMLYDINIIKKSLKGSLLDMVKTNRIDTKGFDVLITYRDNNEAMRQIQDSMFKGTKTSKEGLVKVYIPLTELAKSQFTKIEGVRIHDKPGKDINVVYDMDDVLNNLNEVVFSSLGLMDKLQELKYFNIKRNNHCLTPEQMEQVLSAYSKIETFEKTVPSKGIERITDIEKLDTRVKVWVYTQKFSEELNEFTK